MQRPAITYLVIFDFEINIFKNKQEDYVVSCLTQIESQVSLYKLNPYDFQIIGHVVFVRNCF